MRHLGDPLSRRLERMVGWYLPGGGAPLLPFSDDFNRANGPLGSPWTGATWVVSSNAAVNTPTLGAEQLTNPGFEGTYEDESGGGGGTIMLAPNWNNQNCLTDGTDTLNEDAVTVHGGSKSQFIDGDQYDGVRSDDTVATVVGGWYDCEVWVYPVSGILSFDIPTVYTKNSSGTGSWQQLRGVGRVPTTDLNRRFYLYGGSAAGFNGYVDDASVKALTLSSLFASTDRGQADVQAQVAATFTAKTQAGVVINLDSAAAPANFVLAYHDGTNAYLTKCVAGTYTQLIGSAAAYAAGRVVKVTKSGTTYQLYYNGVQVGANQTISDAGIISNTIHGMFSTYSGNSLDDFSVVAN